MMKYCDGTSFTSAAPSLRLSIMLETLQTHSHLGNLAGTVNYQGHNLYFRGISRIHAHNISFSFAAAPSLVSFCAYNHRAGRANLDAMLADLPNLKLGNGWNNAQQVVLSGCSAGGLSTYHAAEHVASKLPKSVSKYVAIPVSGMDIS